MRGLTTDRAPRVLMTCDAAGGVWTYALDLAHGLRRQGVETVLAGFGAPPSEDRLNAARAVAEVHWTGLPLDWTVQDRADLVSVAPALDALVAGTEADVVQVNAPSQAAGLKTPARVVAVTHSCVATWFHAVKGTDLPPGWRWQHALNAEGMARADSVIAPSRSHAALTMQCYPGCGDIMVVPNAIGHIEASQRRRPVAYAAARWWDAGKDAATLDGAAALTDWPVVAFGPDRSADVAPVKFAHVRHLGTRPHADVRRTAGRAAVFVSPSVYEPFGLAALEAAAGGAALVLSDIPTYRENWDGAALFAPPGDARAFAAQINALSRNPQLRARMAAAARHRAHRFRPEAQAQAMAAFLLADRQVKELT